LVEDFTEPCSVVRFRYLIRGHGEVCVDGVCVSSEVYDVDVSALLACFFQVHLCWSFHQKYVRVAVYAIVKATATLRPAHSITDPNSDTVIAVLAKSIDCVVVAPLATLPAVETAQTVAFSFVVVVDVEPADWYIWDEPATGKPRLTVLR